MGRRQLRQLTEIATLGLTTLAACHHGHSVGAAAAESGNSGSITVRVVNHAWLDITIYLLQGTHRDRVGVATATPHPPSRLRCGSSLPAPNIGCSVILWDRGRWCAASRSTRKTATS